MARRTIPSRAFRPSAMAFYRYWRQFVPTGIKLAAMEICPSFEAESCKWRYMADGDIAYAYPLGDTEYQCVNHAAFYDAVIPSELFGVIATVYHLNRQAWTWYDYYMQHGQKIAEWKEQSEYYTNKYYALLDWAYEHFPTYAAEIHGLLD